MHRRTFLTAAAALAAAPRVAWGQERARRIAIVQVSRPVGQLTATGHPMYVALHEELARLGYVEGENLVIDRWSGRGRLDRDEMARQVVASGPDLIYATSGAAIGPQIVALTKTIPIVTFGLDPVGFGLVSNLRRPGGNVTSISSDPGRGIEGKRLQFLLDVMPLARRVAYLVPRWAWEGANGPAAREGAAVLNVDLTAVIPEPPAGDQEFRKAIASLSRDSVDVLLIAQSAETNVQAVLTAGLLATTRIPAMSPYSQFTKAGGLMSYGVNYPDLMRCAAGYVARILDGQFSGDLPVQQPELFDFVINLKTARELGITIPLKVLIAATEIIE